MKGGARFNNTSCVNQYIRKELTMMKGGARECEVVKKGSDDEGEW